MFGYLLACFSVAQTLHTKALGLGTGGVIMEMVLSATGFCEVEEGRDLGGHEHSGIVLLKIKHIKL